MQTVFSAHGWCLQWRADLIWPTVVGDLCIAAAYFAIPTLLYFFVAPRANLYGRAVRWAMAFILLCGITHVLDVVSIWSPIYYVMAWTKVLTALASCGAVIEFVLAAYRFQKAMDAEFTREEAQRIYTVLRQIQMGMRSAHHGRT